MSGVMEFKPFAKKLAMTPEANRPLIEAYAAALVQVVLYLKTSRDPTVADRKKDTARGKMTLVCDKLVNQARGPDGHALPHPIYTLAKLDEKPSQRHRRAEDSLPDIRRALQVLANAGLLSDDQMKAVNCFPEPSAESRPPVSSSFARDLPQAAQ